MKCCGKEMYNNETNYHCSICGKRINKPFSKACPKCGKIMYNNGNNYHCYKCNYRKYLI